MYHPEVQPFLNSTEELDKRIRKLWSYWSPEGEIDLDGAANALKEAAAVSPNMQTPKNYLDHCDKVSEMCPIVGSAILEHYGFLEGEISLPQLAFAGRVEDFLYTIGGNGKNNGNGRDSNPFHEILTYMQVEYMGHVGLAEGMSMP